jgi:hypothetical protein
LSHEHFPHFNLEEELAMSNVIMIGCDLHEDFLMLKMATGLENPETRSWKNTVRDRQQMVADLKPRAKKVGLS